MILYNVVYVLAAKVVLTDPGHQTRVRLRDCETPDNSVERKLERGTLTDLVTLPRPKSLRSCLRLDLLFEVVVVEDFIEVEA